MNYVSYFASNRRNNPADFCDHVLSHIDGNNSRTCQWSNRSHVGGDKRCTAEIVSGVRAHVREVHTVPRLLCPFCLAATYTRKCELFAHIGMFLVHALYYKGFK